MPNATINDLPTPEELTAFAQELRFPEYELSEFLPDDNIVGTTYRFDATVLVKPAASKYRAWDTEAPISDRQGVARASQEIPPLSEKKLLTEAEFLTVRALQTGEWAEYIDQIYDDVTNLVEAIHARWELDRGALLGSGQVTLQFNNGQGVDVVYPVPSGNKVVAGTLWSDVANADIVTYVKALVTAYKLENNGLAPGEILIPDAVQGLLMRNTALRSLIYHVAGSSAPSTTSWEAIQNELRAHNLPLMRVINSQAMDSDGVMKYVLPQNKIVMLPGGGRRVGATVKGTTGAALGLVQEGTLELSAASDVVAMAENDNDPARRKNMVDACGMPVLAGAKGSKQLFIAQVLA